MQQKAAGSLYLLLLPRSSDRGAPGRPPAGRDVTQAEEVTGSGGRGQNRHLEFTAGFQAIRLPGLRLLASGRKELALLGWLCMASPRGESPVL